MLRSRTIKKKTITDAPQRPKKKDMSGKKTTDSNSTSEEVEDFIRKYIPIAQTENGDIMPDSIHCFCFNNLQSYI